MARDSFNKNQDILRKNRGNALVLILVLIALMAGLSMAVMKSSNRTSTNMDAETVRVQAERLMRQAKSIETGVGLVMSANQCGENEVNFVNTVTTRDYTNPTAPVNKRCDLFSLEGAGLTYNNPSPAVLDSSLSARADYGEWVFSATHCVLKIGPDDDDSCTNSEVALIAIVPHINQSTCMQINNLNNIENPSGVPPEESYNETVSTFIGSYAAVADPELGEGVNGTQLIGHTTGCFRNTSGVWTNSYVFYHILNSR